MEGTTADQRPTDSRSPTSTGYAEENHDRRDSPYGLVGHDAESQHRSIAHTIYRGMQLHGVWEGFGKASHSILDLALNM